MLCFQAAYAGNGNIGKVLPACVVLKARPITHSENRVENMAKMVHHADHCCIISNPWQLAWLPLV
jgi:hypothetical protein